MNFVAVRRLCSTNSHRITYTFDLFYFHFALSHTPLLPQTELLMQLSRIEIPLANKDFLMKLQNNFHISSVQMQEDNSEI